MNEQMETAMHGVFDKIDAMSDEEFRAKLAEYDGGEFAHLLDPKQPPEQLTGNE